MKKLGFTTAICLALLFCLDALAQSSPKLLYRDRDPQQQTGNISILDAVYGQDERLCNARDVVARSCDGEASCVIAANDRLCGNPYHSVRKDFFVAYDCGDGRRTLTVSEDEQAHIYCLQESHDDGGSALVPRPPRNWQRGRIYVAQAFYGTEYGVCEALDKFVQACNEQSACNVKVDNKLCGDPARGQKKKAQITYWCNGEARDIQVAEKSTASLSCR